MTHTMSAVSEISRLTHAVASAAPAASSLSAIRKLSRNGLLGGGRATSGQNTLSLRLMRAPPRPVDCHSGRRYASKLSVLHALGAPTAQSKGSQSKYFLKLQRAANPLCLRRGFLITGCVLDSCQPRSASLRWPRRTNALGNISGTKTWVKHIDLRAFRSKSKTASASPNRTQATSGLHSSGASPFDGLQLQD